MVSSPPTHANRTGARAAASIFTPPRAHQSRGAAAPLAALCSTPSSVPVQASTVPRNAPRAASTHPTLFRWVHNGDTELGAVDRASSAIGARAETSRRGRARIAGCLRRC
ncbi:hypothetical protein B0H11DRAFT_2247290 [Mycena galericulata]|nr:hypothetical protein B0H11DRAFT_2247290 [Mycena galericulata]